MGGSVRATHLFSSEGEILRIRRLIPDALHSVHHLLVARDVAGDAAGFIGSDGREIAMLFLAPEMRGKGLGRRLVLCATDRFSANEVTANKQNPQALDFYRNMGFCA